VVCDRAYNAPTFNPRSAEVRQNDNPLIASLDTLSSIGRKLLKLDAATAYTKLLVDSPGSSIAHTMLESITPRDLIDGPIVSEEDAAGLLSGLWLRHDYLDESHRISQQIQTESGSMWHAIMHRREGDFSNSKYWYDRTEDHLLYKTLAVRAGDVINPFPADKSVFRIIANGWNPQAFVDLVQQVHDKPNDPRHPLAVMIQEVEWQSLFEHCTRAASGK
jgi:hypothetical protein